MVLLPAETGESYRQRTINQSSLGLDSDSVERIVEPVGLESTVLVCFIRQRVEWGLTKDCVALFVRHPQSRQADWYEFEGEYELASVRINRIISLSQLVIHIV